MSSVFSTFPWRHSGAVSASSWHWKFEDIIDHCSRLLLSLVCYRHCLWWNWKWYKRWPVFASHTRARTPTHQVSKWWVGSTRQWGSLFVSWAFAGVRGLILNDREELANTWKRRWVDKASPGVGRGFRSVIWSGARERVLVVQARMGAGSRTCTPAFLQV